MNIVLVQALLLLFGIACFTVAFVWGSRLLIDFVEAKKKEIK